MCDSQCSYCKNCDPKKWGIGKCRAFPRGIPNDILLGRHNHNLPYPEDNGILFEPEDDKAARAWAIKSDTL